MQDPDYEGAGATLQSVTISKQYAKLLPLPRY